MSEVLEKKFHYSPKTGAVGPCKADKRACPFGDTRHFANEDEAYRGYETEVSETQQEYTKRLATFKSFDTKLLNIAESHLEAVAKLKEHGNKRGRAALVQEVQELRGVFDRTMSRLHVHAQHVAIAQLQLEKMGLPVKEEAKSRFMKDEQRKYWSTLRKKVFFDDKSFESKSMRRAIITEFTAWSGLEREEAEELLNSYDENNPQGWSRDEYTVSLFQQHFDNTRDRVFVDIETTGFHPANGSEIIEIGIVRTKADGTEIERINRRFDLADPYVKSQLGTGPEEIHRISPKDLKGLPTFGDPEVQKEMAKHLTDPNVILVAHNAGFEETFFNHHLDEYYDRKNDNSVDRIIGKRPHARIQDTRAIAMFLAHSLPNTKLESFSKGNGVSYENAHRAIVDADIMKDSLHNFVESLKSAPLGQRPNLVIEE